MKMKDADVRKLLLDDLIKEYGHDPATCIINELGIDFGASRIDVAVVNGIMHGYEIKSESDNLSRLPRQVKYYNKLFERMTIVTCSKYLDDVLEIIPTWWGVSVVSQKKDRLISKRKGRLTSSQDKHFLLKLLWKKDLENLVDHLGLPKKTKKMRKNKLISLFMEEADLSIIRPFVYSVLKERKSDSYNSLIVN
ncbi:sce7726 family protein [Bacillaceae bacterium S4-13-56]